MMMMMMMMMMMTMTMMITATTIMTTIMIDLRRMTTVIRKKAMAITKATINVCLLLTICDHDDGFLCLRVMVMPSPIFIFSVSLAITGYNSIYYFL